MRKIIIVLLCFIVVLLLAYSGYRGYELWKQNHWVTLARAYAANHDVQNERLCLEQALQMNKRNVEACRMMANLTEFIHSPTALDWRKEVVKLDPDSLPDRLALAQTAIFSHDLATAKQTLADLDTAGKNTAPYYNILGELALSTGKPDEAEADFAQAARLDPSDPGPQVSLAVIELHGSNTLDMAEARITLKRLSMNSTNVDVRLQAKRELTYDALRFKDYPSALSFSEEMVKGPGALFSDKLLRLEALRLSQNSEYRPFFASLEIEAATNHDELAPMATWLMERNMAPQALGWLQTLPANVQTNLPAAPIEAECQMLMQNWSAVRSSLSKENWGRLDYMRYAYLARALRQQGLYEASKVEWDVAVKSVNNDDLGLTALFRLAAAWNWQEEGQQILWTIINNYPQEKWAQYVLVSDLYANGSTRPLMQLFTVQVNRDPSNLEARNNLALTAMLLNAQEINPYDLAREAYQTAPTNSYFACTYAFSLYLQGKSSQALQIMQRIDPKLLNNSSTAGYYGLILKADGDNAQAATYLRRAVRGQLLPEERTMFQRAMQGL